MEDFESLHFAGDWGALVSEDGELASVPDLVRVLVHGGVPSWDAVDAVLDRIGHDEGVRGYITHPHKYARPIGPHYDWAARFPESRVRPSWAPRSLDALRGLQWLIAALRAYWKQEPAPADWQEAQRSPGERFERRLYVDLFGGQFAIHLDDAHRLFKNELLAAVPAASRTERGDAVREYDLHDEWATHCGVWLKAGEGGRDQLVRCGRLVPLVMKRDACYLDAAIDTVIDMLRQETEPGDVFILRRGYAAQWQPKGLRSPTVDWKEGSAIPEGYGAASLAVDPRQTRNPYEWFRKGIKWNGPGQEPRRLQGLDGYWEELRASWRERESSGDVDGQVDKPHWSSLVAVRRSIAVEAGLLGCIKDAAPTPGPQLLPPPAVAADLGSTVATHVKGERWSEAEMQTMRDLREAGVSDVEIAKRFGCERAIIHQKIGARKKRVATASGSTWPTYGRPQAVK